MVEFMYTNEYDDEAEERGSEDLPLSDHTEAGILNQGKECTYGRPQLTNHQANQMIETPPTLLCRQTLILSRRSRRR